MRRILPAGRVRKHITFALRCLTGCMARTREQFPVCVYLSEMPRVCGGDTVTSEDGSQF